MAEYAEDEPAAHLSRIPMLPAIISHAGWLYHRFGLSFRDVEELLAERGITVTYEAMRQWCLTFGLDYVRRLRRRRGRMGDTWYLDELFVKIQRWLQYLWRAVDEDGDVIDILVRSQEVAARYPVRNRHVRSGPCRRFGSSPRNEQMSHSVRQHLRVEIDEYDAQIRRFIPAYETMIAVAADAVSAVEPHLVVDLGAGTGGLSELLLDRRGVGTVELLDIDPEMLDHARRRLARFGDRARFTLRSYDEPFPSCAAFAASLSLHHIPTIEAKAALYARAFSALGPGGVLVNADTNMPTDRAERGRLFRYWADHMVAKGISADRAWQYFDEWAEEDTYMSLEAELAELTRAGFEAARVWHDGPEGVVVARKP